MGTRVVTATSPELFGGAWGAFSDCERYRYLLAIPTGEANERVVAFCLANPSKATPDKLDPTVTRCVNYARTWGYGWVWIVNVRAWRETDPLKVPADPLAIGPENDAAIIRALFGAEIFVCGWGKLGGDLGAETLHLVKDCGVTPKALKLNKDGSPAHPLYLRADLTPFAMEVRRG